MVWKNPKTTWKSEDTVTEKDFNRIEGNIEYAINLVETGKSLLKKTIVSNGIPIVTDTPTFEELSNSINKIAPNITDTNASASQILSGKKAVVQNKLVTGSMVDRGTQNKTLNTDMETYTIPEGYHNGNGKVKTNITNLYARNIKAGETVGGVKGTHGFKFIHFSYDSSYPSTLPNELVINKHETIPPQTKEFVVTVDVGFTPDIINIYPTQSNGFYDMPTKPTVIIRDNSWNGTEDVSSSFKIYLTKVIKSNNIIKFYFMSTESKHDYSVDMSVFVCTL